MSDRLRIVVGSDDAGLQYKEVLKADLTSDDRVAEVTDVGVNADETTAYPHVAVAAAQLIAEGKADRAVLVCGTGNDTATTEIYTLSLHDVSDLGGRRIIEDVELGAEGRGGTAGHQPPRDELQDQDARHRVPARPPRRSARTARGCGFIGIGARGSGLNAV